MKFLLSYRPVDGWTNMLTLQKKIKLKHCRYIYICPGCWVHYSFQTIWWIIFVHLQLPMHVFVIQQQTFTDPALIQPICGGSMWYFFLVKVNQHLAVYLIVCYISFNSGNLIIQTDGSINQFNSAILLCLFIPVSVIFTLCCKIYGRSSLIINK